MTKCLNYKLKNLLVNEIENYISDCINNQYVEHNKKIDADDDYDDEVIDDLIFEMFNSFETGLNFGEYVGDNTTLTKYTIKLIQYCNNYYESEYGRKNWKDFDNFEKIINYAGCVFVNDNRNVFIQLWNKLIE
jgi:adenine C2-methylase RlmN of 23S rRNA A2503 and tRNA A37